MIKSYKPCLWHTREPLIQGKWSWDARMQIAGWFDVVRKARLTSGGCACISFACVSYRFLMLTQAGWSPEWSSFVGCWKALVPVTSASIVFVSTSKIFKTLIIYLICHRCSKTSLDFIWLTCESCMVRSVRGCYFFIFFPIFSGSM